MNRDKVKLRLVVDVTYNLGRTNVRDLKQVLVKAADHLHAEGLLSGSTEASVDTWTSEVVELGENDVTRPSPRELKSESSLPTEAGFWWARTTESKSGRYDKLVEVYGEVPFLRLRAWDRTRDEIVLMDSWHIKEWGPRIVEPTRVNWKKEG